MFCPDLPGSEISISIARGKFEKKIQISFDTAMRTRWKYSISRIGPVIPGLISIGSVNSHNMFNITEASSYITRTIPRGHKYAISIATDAAPGYTHPSYGGNHTSLFGKLAKGATTAYVPCDPSIALPMIITALSQTAAKFMKGRKRPTFSFSGRDMNIDVP